MELFKRSLVIVPIMVLLCITLALVFLNMFIWFLTGPGELNKCINDVMEFGTDYVSKLTNWTLER